MSNASNLFNFGRSLPKPFDTVTKKKIPVSSKYGDGMQSTLCSTVIKAVNMLCKLNNLAEKGAVALLITDAYANINPQTARTNIISLCTINQAAPRSQVFMTRVRKQ